MLTYSLEDRGRLAVYEYLYRCIRDDILSGRIKANEKLPSKRALSQHLKISVITVENAYSQLISEGYVYSEEKRGYFVSKLETVQATAEKTEDVPEEKQPEYFMDFKTNSINSEYFPLSVWSKIMRGVLASQDIGLLDPVPYNGIYELRAAIAQHLYRFRGIKVNASQIIVGAGTEYLYSLIIQLLGRDKIFAVENPGYVKMTKIYKSNGAGFRCVSMDDNGVSIKSLEQSGADVLHISPSHHFPTGTVTPIKRRQELLKWACEKDERYIIEDDYDSEFRFSGKPLPTMQSIDSNQKVIYINSFSKSIAPSMRISYMILPAQLTEKFKDTLSFYSCTVPRFEQYALARFISDGYFESHINRMKKRYRAIRDAVIDTVCKSGFCSEDDIFEKDSGLHFLIKIRSDKSDEQIKQLASEQGINLSFMSEYLCAPSDGYEKFIVVNYSGIDVSRLPEALRRMKQVL